MSRAVFVLFAVFASGCSLVIDPDLGPIASGGKNECGSDSACDDADGCTDDTCREGTCVHSPRDDDGDGFGRIDCDGTDCNDSDPDIKPSALERCDDGTDQDCDGLTDLADPDCGPGPENDTCSSPYELDPSPPGGTGRVVGDTSIRTDDDEPDCAQFDLLGAPDVFFHLPMETPREVTFDTFESEFDTVLELRTTDCTDGGFAIACSGEVNEHNDAKIVMRTLESPVFVLLDGDGLAPQGRYVLNYAIQPVRPQLSCGAPMDITGGAAVYGRNDFDSFDDDEHGSCGGEGSADEVFRLDLTVASRLTAITHGSFFDTVLYVRRGACGGEEVACVDTGAGTEEFDQDLPAGVYYLFVDGARGEEGTYRLGVKVDPG